MRLAVWIKKLPEGGYTAKCPSLPGCQCRAPDRASVVKRMDETITGYLAAVGDFVPHELHEQLIEV